jgi:hypothetical protein
MIKVIFKKNEIDLEIKYYLCAAVAVNCCLISNIKLKNIAVYHD